MKNIPLLIILFTLVCCHNAMAQGSPFGVKTGINFTILEGFVNVKPVFKPGLVLGIYTSSQVSNRFHLQPELLYTRMGSKYDHIDPLSTTSEGKTTVSLSYLALPIMGKLYVVKQFNLQFGGQFGLLLSAGQNGEVNGKKIDEDLKEYIKSTDLSFGGGFGIDVKPEINFGGRLMYGVTDISTLPKTGWGYTRPNWRNIAFQFHVGYSFLRK